MAGDPFLSSVVVSSTATSVDTAEVAGASVRLRAAAGDARAAAAALDAARSDAAAWWGRAPARTAVLAAEIEEARALARASARELEGLADALSLAAVVYAAAEGDAARFESVLAAASGHPLRPFPTHVGPAVRRWFDGHGMSGCPDWLVDLFAGGLVMTPVSMGRLAAEGKGFAGGTGDAATGARVQMDLAALADRLVAHTLVLKGEGADLDAPGAVGAARLAASWGAGLGAGAVGGSTSVLVATGAPGERRTRVVGTRTEPEFAAVSALPGDPLGAVALLSLAGTAGGALSPLMSRSDPLREARRRLSAPGVGSAPVASPTPMTGRDLLGELEGMESGEGIGRIKILKHETPGGSGTRVSWSVVIRGTQEWTTGGAHPQDLLTNLQAVGGRESAQGAAVVEAMRMAGVEPGQKIDLVGHSQGGIIAAQIASDPRLAEEFDIASVLTAGSPIGGFAPRPGVDVLALENVRDIVPALDGLGNRGPRTTTVAFDGAAVDGVEPGGGVPAAHDAGLYREAMRRLEAADEGPAAEVGAWAGRRRQALGLTGETTTTAFVFETTRSAGD
ncbi:hypothetical protein M3T53_01235 [Actinomyces sp. B33]|uniref:hypothetical protein n=1 Tax=Actinomyces sp. B33 TaxID=2942131 RepID=UPI002341CECC|nr:hypothetical protein [Actinomyces sp. B33]MDC4232338.1 hypothetical protein [Actinomyces sp. B33]